MGGYLTLRQWGKCIRGCGLHQSREFGDFSGVHIASYVAQSRL